jgi:hypothetical protein
MKQSNPWRIERRACEWQNTKPISSVPNNDRLLALCFAFFLSRFVLLSIVFFFVSLFCFLSYRFFFCPLICSFICRSASCSSFSFVILRYVFLCPHFLLSLELFVRGCWTILSPFVAKLTTKMIASDQISSLTLWQSGRISGSPRTAVKVGPWSNRSVRRLGKFVDQRVDR